MAKVTSPQWSDASGSAYTQKPAYDALHLLEQLAIQQEQGVSDIVAYVDLLRRTIEDPNVSPTVQRGAGILRNLIDLRAAERRRLSDVGEVVNHLMSIFQEAQGSWPQAAHDLEQASENATDENNKAIFHNLRNYIQFFIDTYLLTVLESLRQPLKLNELASLVKHYKEAEQGQAEGSPTPTLETEVTSEIVRQKYAHVILFFKEALGDEELSQNAKDLLMAIHQITPSFPGVGDSDVNHAYLHRQFDNDSFIGDNLGKMLEKLGEAQSTPSSVQADEELPDSSPGVTKFKEAIRDDVPVPLTSLKKTYYKSSASKIVDASAGSVAPGEVDMLDDCMEYVQRTWKDSLTWEPHPNYEPMRYFRDHLVRLQTSGHIMELLFRGYRTIRRFHASDLMTLDTRKLLRIPSVRELVCLMVYPKFKRIGGFNDRFFESLLGRQYAGLLYACREITNLDVFLHDEWPENLEQFMDKFNETYDMLMEESPRALERVLGMLGGPFKKG